MSRHRMIFAPVRKRSHDPLPALRVTAKFIASAAAIATAFFLIQGALNQPKGLVANQTDKAELPERVTEHFDQPEIPERLCFRIFTRGADRDNFDRFIHHHITAHGGQYLHHTTAVGKTRHYLVPAEYARSIEPLKQASALNVLAEPDETFYPQWISEASAQTPPATPARADTHISVRVVQPAFEQRQTVYRAAASATIFASAMTGGVIATGAIQGRRRREQNQVLRAQDEYNRNG